MNRKDQCYVNLDGKLKEAVFITAHEHLNACTVEVGGHEWITTMDKVCTPEQKNQMEIGIMKSSNLVWFVKLTEKTLKRGDLAKIANEIKCDYSALLRFRDRLKKLGAI